MKLFSIIFSLYFFFSVSILANMNEFKKEVLNSISTITSLSKLKILEKSNPLIIPYTWTPILEGRTEIANKKKSYICLMYYFNKEENKESLALYSHSIAKKCTQLNEKDFSVKVTDLNQVQFKVIEQENTIDLSFLKNKELQLLRIPFYNLPLDLWSKKNFFDSEVLSSQTMKRKYPGVFVLPSEVSLRPDTLYGELDDLYSKGKTKVCHDFNSKCEETIAFECGQCRYGWFSTIGRGCENGTRKYCGVDRCGNKGEPACPRGFIHKRSESKEQVCSEKSQNAFCKTGLQLFCNEQKVLVCL
tara:strand:+ start:160166 stop:161071 length:906 start_codon:yes stop_codon:yes gene_type:complete